MDFIEKLGDAITGMGRDVSQKVTDVTEIAKLRMDIRSKEESVRKQYLEIGKQYYALHKDDAEPLFEEVVLIKETLEKIEELKAQIAENKGKKVCPNCGAPNEADASYCSKCGAKCEEAYAEEPMEPVEMDAEPMEMKKDPIEMGDGFVETDAQTEDVNTKTEE